MIHSRRMALQYFFSTLYATVEEGCVEIRPFTRNGELDHRKRVFLPSNDSAALAQHVVSIGNSLHTYFGVCTRTDEGRRLGRGTLDHVDSLTALWADLDVKTFGGLNRARNALDRFPLSPSILVFTGHGYHAYWLLEEPISLTSSGRAAPQAVLKALQVDVLGSDDVSDLARVLRAPWSYNLKDTAYPSLAKVLSLQETRYSWDSLLELLPWQETLPKADSSTCGGMVDGRYHGIGEVMGSDFIHYCREHAKTLSEPLWYAMITNLIGFRGGRPAIHDLSRLHPSYSVQATQSKIAHALKDAPGPHSYGYIADHGFRSSDLSDPSQLSPASRAFVRQEMAEIVTSDQSSDGVTR
jgi:hypothetical protein